MSKPQRLNARPRPKASKSPVKAVTAGKARPKNKLMAATYNPLRAKIYSPITSSNKDYNALDRREVMRQARHARDNDPTASRLVEISCQYSSGVEFIPNSSSTDYNQQAAISWARFSRKPLTDMNCNLKQAQSMTLAGVVVDGDCFILKTELAGKPKIRLYESHQVSTPESLKEQEGITIFEGVEIDPLPGTPIAYYFETTDGHKKVPAEFVIHVYDPERPGQRRGLSRFSPALNTISSLRTILEAETAAVIDAAKTSKVIKTKTGELRPDSGLARRVGKKLDANTSAARDRVNVLLQDAGPETLVLDKDEEYQQFQQLRPSDSVAKFWDDLRTDICTAFGLPVQVVLPTRATGPTQRAILETAARTYEELANIISVAFYEVYKYVAEYEKRKTPAFFKNAPGDWLEVSHIIPRPPGIDASRNSAAMLNEYRVGATSLQQIIASAGRSDWKSVLRQKAEAEQYRQELAKEFKINPETISALTDTVINQSLTPDNTQPTV